MTIEAGEPSWSYYLSECFLGGESIEISEKQYRALNEAITTLGSAIEIEGLFQVFAQSFLRFEKDLLDVALEDTYANIRALGYEDFRSNIRNRFNVDIITILTSFKSYDDQCNRILKSSINPPKTKDFNCTTRSKAFDSHLSYRICANLRDYAQHRALPLGGFSIGGNADFDRDDAGIFRKLGTGFNVSPWLDVAKFRSSSQCKALLGAELDSLGYQKIDMKWLLRSFAGAMYERHAALRAFLKPAIEAAGEQIAGGYDFASATKSSEAQFLELHGDGEKRHMRNDLDAKVLRSFETYPSLMSAKNLYVTSQIRPEAATYSGQLDA